MIVLLDLGKSIPFNMLAIIAPPEIDDDISAFLPPLLLGGSNLAICFGGDLGSFTKLFNSPRAYANFRRVSINAVWNLLVSIILDSPRNSLCSKTLSFLF